MAPDDNYGIIDSSAIIPTADNGVRTRDITLQTLNAYLPSNLTDTGKLFYPKELFEQSVSNWNGKYIIYIPSGEHLNWQNYLSNPDKEMKKYNARRVGLIQEARIPEVGSPRLDAWAVFMDDEANERADNGTLGISTDFNCPIMEDRLVGSLTPNYVACFPIEVANQQMDIGARITNSAPELKPLDLMETKIMEDDVKGSLAELKGLITGFISAFKSANVQNSAPAELIEAATVEVQPSVPVEYLNQIEAMKQENEAASARLAELQTQYDALKATDAERAEQAKQAEMQRLETVWQTTIMPKLPAALLVDEVKAAEIKALAIEKPLEFMEQYSDVMNKPDINVANSNPTGQSHQNSNPEEKDFVIGSYNAITGRFE
jgi:hypothetical protein